MIIKLVDLKNDFGEVDQDLTIIFWFDYYYYYFAKLNMLWSSFDSILSVVSSSAYVLNGYLQWNLSRSDDQCCSERFVDTRELHGDKKLSPFPPRKQSFVPITAATAVMLLKMSPLPRLPRFYHGNQFNLLKAVPITAATAVKMRTRSPLPRFYRGNPAVTAVGNTVQVSSGHIISVLTEVFYKEIRGLRWYSISVSTRWCKL